MTNTPGDPLNPYGDQNDQPETPESTGENAPETPADPPQWGQPEQQTPADPAPWGQPASGSDGSDQHDPAAAPPPAPEESASSDFGHPGSTELPTSPYGSHAADAPAGSSEPSTGSSTGDSAPGYWEQQSQQSGDSPAWGASPESGEPQWNPSSAESVGSSQAGDSASSDPYSDPYSGAAGNVGQSPYGSSGQSSPPAYEQSAGQSYGAPAAPQSYGQQGYGQQAYGGYGYAMPAQHPQATTALVTGLIGLIGGFICALPLLASPFAWVIGRKAMKEIDASNGQLGGRGNAQAGMITGIIGTVLLGLGLLLLIVIVIAAIASGA